MTKSTHDALVRAWRGVFSRERVTSALELLGAASVVAGCFVLLGLGAALLAAGAALLLIGFLASGGER